MEFVGLKYIHRAIFFPQSLWAWEDGVSYSKTQKEIIDKKNGQHIIPNFSTFFSPQIQGCFSFLMNYLWNNMLAFPLADSIQTYV